MSLTKVSYSMINGAMFNARDYGVLGNGSDEGAAIQVALTAAVGSSIYFPPGSYNQGTTSLKYGGVTVVGAGRGNTSFTYSGTGVAFDGWTNAGGNLQSLSITCSNSAASAIKIGNKTQHVFLNDVAVYGTGTGSSGCGLLLDGSTSDLSDVFSGNLYSQLFYSYGFKYGIKVTGPAPLSTLSNAIWTTFSFNQTYLIGPNKDAGSIGLYMDKAASGTGSVFLGGTVESFNVGLTTTNHAYGLEFIADLENNNSTYSVDSYFIGQIKLSPATAQFEQRGSAVAEYRRLAAAGYLTTETYYSQNHVIGTDYPGPAAVEWGVAIGASAIGGGSPSNLLKAVSNGSFASPEASYVQVFTHKVSYATSVPTGGTWAQGDRVFNSAATVGHPKGWLCTSASDITTGSVGTGSAALTVVSTGIQNGDVIKVAGAGVAGADLTTTVASGGGTVNIILTATASTTVVSAVVTTPGTWVSEGNL